eukprot:m51a1_g8272 hypothetical protein (339) ;mRNA; r:62216-63646
MSRPNTIISVANIYGTQTPSDYHSTTARGRAPVVDDLVYAMFLDASSAEKRPAAIVSASADQVSTGGSPLAPRTMTHAEQEEKQVASATVSSKALVVAALLGEPATNPRAVVGEFLEVSHYVFFASVPLFFCFGPLSLRSIEILQQVLAQPPLEPVTPGVVYQDCSDEMLDFSQSDSQQLIIYSDDDCGLEETSGMMRDAADEPSEKPEQEARDDKDDAVSESGYSADDEAEREKPEPEQQGEDKENEDGACEWAPPTHRGSKRAREEVFAEEADLDELPTKKRITASLTFEDTIAEKEQAPTGDSETSAKKRPREEACASCPQIDGCASEPPAKKRC